MDVNDLKRTNWFSSLREEVARAVDRLGDQRRDQRPVLERELHALQEQIQGWSMTLAKPDLSPTLRAAIEADYERALVRQQQIESFAAEEEMRKQHLHRVLDPRQVVDRLNRLDESLASNNPTLGNLELSLHIDRINCFSDGHVAMRTCKLGVLADCIGILAEDVEAPRGSPAGGNTGRITPRRRARLRTEGLAGDREGLKAATYLAADPQRFVNLPDQWFWLDEFHIPEKKSWAEEHAVDVARARATGLTNEKLAVRFGKSIPTIRKALLAAAKQDEYAGNLPKKMPRSRWHEDHAAEVARLKESGMGTMDLASHFKKSDTTIRAALKHYEDLPINDKPQAAFDDTRKMDK